MQPVRSPRTSSTPHFYWVTYQYVKGKAVLTPFEGFGTFISFGSDLDTQELRTKSSMEIKVLIEGTVISIRNENLAQYILAG